jgi:hypothetical protein
VTENTSSNVYDYLIGEGTSYTNVLMYRDTIGDILSLVNSTEYSLNTTSYAGVTVARFPLRQAKFGGGLHNLYATATGLSAEQNFARAIRTTMANSIWGLSQAVDNTTFSQIESLLASVGSLSCDGVLAVSRPAVDILNQLLIVRGMTLSKTTSSYWTLAIDQGSTSAVYQATFGHGKGQPWNNVTAFGGLTRTPLQDAISHLALEYAVEYRTGHYRNTVTRSVLAIGRERRISHDFIQTGVTADKVVDYLSKRLLQGDQKAQFTAGQEARNLNVGNLILYTAPQLGLTEQVFRITELSRRLDTTQLNVEGWASSIYSYTMAGSIPPDAGIPIESVWSVTTPSAPTSLMIIGSGTTTNSQGGYTAFQTLRYNVVNEAFAQTFVRQRTSGNSQWLTVAVDQLAGNNLTTRIDQLITGLPYDYQVDRVNLLNPSLHASTMISSQTAPTDNAAPGTPGTPTITGQHLKDITLQWTEASGGDIKDYEWEVRTSSSGGGSQLATSRAGTIKASLTLDSASYGTTYYFRVRAKDYSGNVGSWSSDRSFNFTRAVTDDVVDNSMTVNGAYSSDTTDAWETSETQRASLTISTNGGAVVVTAKFQAVMFYTPGGLALQASYSLRKDSITGAILDLGEIRLDDAGASQLFSTICVATGVDTSPAATQTYVLGILGVSSQQGYSKRYRLTAVNLKK